MLFRSLSQFLSVAWVAACLGYGAYLALRRSEQSRHDRLIALTVLALIAAAGTAVILGLGALASEALNF
jgi:hypothetical protein